MNTLMKTPTARAREVVKLYEQVGYETEVEDMMQEVVMDLMDWGVDHGIDTADMLRHCLRHGSIPCPCGGRPAASECCDGTGVTTQASLDRLRRGDR